MLLPSKVKHRKWTKGRRRAAVESRGNELSFGTFGLQVISGDKWIDSRHIEASRRAIIRAMKKGGKMWIRIFPDKPVTKKGTEVPMGGGKGGVDHFVFPVRPGRVLFELDGVSEEVAREALRVAGHKLPVRTRIIKR
ncbi:MAG: 50S ribosomal protein L16 [Candidatus Spechtbacteria bacterium RIFCSPHIGHO2_02_FULL_43_15b]|uniref:Large ribosomal subunit protein uL16 n=1 Tax=Candidatus Spechtbacteria bacterium RIFCSPHIGHO2_01_FULL_43_30 TaxID=1802158 RepID=A0A1G2H8G9_9BACT|nr:MAG: 50S ribosomal protein L16 [Candidatus Spechtbacteria bacterium RIFCSPHIGHO2_01_FULL_43_30]OGZ59708.1 MAG: 50S ribosomal protein L16 [Candidatus Spechtbacteria bacterium RIFCSPHIGHO2_02_FULL_43_15b]